MHGRQLFSNLVTYALQCLSINLLYMMLGKRSYCYPECFYIQIATNVEKCEHAYFVTHVDKDDLKNMAMSADLQEGLCQMC